MPKEQIRKRGRRKPKVQDEYDIRKPVETPSSAPEQAVTEAQPAQAGPSGLHPDRLALLASGGRRPPPPHPDGEEGGVGGEGQQQEQQQPWGRQFGLVEEFPFGELDPDKKGFVKAAEEQIKDWVGAESGSAGETREGGSWVLICSRCVIELTKLQSDKGIYPTYSSMYVAKNSNWPLIPTPPCFSSDYFLPSAIGDEGLLVMRLAGNGNYCSNIDLDHTLFKLG